MKKIYMLALALLVVFSMAISVEAFERKIIERQNGLSAYADWMETTPDGSTAYTYLSATESNVGTDIYLSMCTYDMTGNGLCKSGYMNTQDKVFSMKNNLNSASLEATIDLYQWYCDEYGCWETVETVPIDVTWTGTGDVSKDSYKWSSRYGDYIAKGSSSSSSREATAEGSIDDQDIGTSDYGGLAKFKSVYMEIMK